MVLVSETLALLIFGSILVASAIVAFHTKNYDTYDKGIFHTFISVLAGLGVFITFMFYYNVVSLQNQQQNLAAIQEMARINETSLTSMLDEMDNVVNEIPNFVMSLSPLNKKLCCENCNIPDDPKNPLTCTIKTTLSYRIFSLWQEMIQSNKFINYDPTAYVASFLQRANSAQLYEQWSISYINFNDKTIAFGELLFRYGLPITTQTPTEYLSVATKLVLDPVFIKILS